MLIFRVIFKVRLSLCALTFAGSAIAADVAAPAPAASEIVAATAPAADLALLTAAQRSEWNKVRELLKNGADPQQADAAGVTPLIVAATAGHLPTIQLLLAAGAPFATTDSRGRSALGHAIAHRQTAVVEALLAHQPALPEPAAGGNDLAAAALNSGDPELLDTILRRLPPGLTWTPAARTEFAKTLAARNALLGALFLAKFSGQPAPTAQSQPLMAYAIARGDTAQVRALLDFGADPNTVLDQPGDTAFREWISSNYVKYYLESTTGISMLMLAAGMKQTDCVKLLMAHGANRLATTRGRAKLLALYFAAWADCPEAIQALIPDSPAKESLRIEISLAEQRARFFRDDQLALTTTISTGRSGFPTKPGEYVVTDKHRDHRSSIYHDASMPFFMRLSCKDFGLHQGHVTGRPASHGCIRLPSEIARRLFQEVPVGTWVSVRAGTTETVAATTGRKRASR